MNDETGNTVYAGFGLIMNGAKGANASDFWYGGYNAVYSDDNIFSYTAPETPYSGDSGAIVSRKDRTVAPGETVSLSCYVGIGSAEELKALIKEMLSATTDYKNEQLTDLEPNSLYELSITESDGTQNTHPITSTPEGTIPMTGTDDKGDPYSIIGKTSSLVKKGDGENTEDSDPITIEVAGRPETPEAPNVPYGTVDDIITPSDVVTTDNSITFPSNPNTEYTIDGEKTLVGAHTFGDRKTVTEPDCTTEGKKKHICTVCCYYEFGTIDALEHVLEKIDKVEPTCTEDGKKEFYTCTVCDKLFADSEGKSEITLADTVIPALGHSFENGVCTVCSEPDPNYAPEPEPAEGDIIVDTENNVGGAGVDANEVKNAIDITLFKQIGTLL